MGLFTRFTDIVNANINSMLDKAEQPEKMISLIIAEMEETLIEVRGAAAKNIAEQKAQVRRLKALQASVAHWHNQAELALSKDREDLAKSALAQKHKYQQELSLVEQEGVQVSEFLESIQSDAAKLQDKLAEAKRRQEALLLRQQSASVRLKVREQAVIYNIDAAMAKFERYQQKIDKVEAQVEAYDLTHSGTNKQSLEAQFAELAQAESIEKDLQQLKQKRASV